MTNMKESTIFLGSYGQVGEVLHGRLQVIEFWLATPK